MANTEYINKYNRDNYYTITLRVPKEKKEVIDAIVLKTDKSKNQLFIEAFEKQYKTDLSIPVDKLLRDNK